MTYDIKSVLYAWALMVFKYFHLVVIVPDRRSQILEVVIVRRLVTWVLGIWKGEGLGKGLRNGRSVYKQPETRVDGSCHS
jgi:hypothetical protein